MKASRHSVVPFCRRATVCFAMAGCMVFMGCAQNRPGNPFQNPNGQAGSPLQSLGTMRPRNRQNITDLYRRAQEQERLAYQQQQELTRLRDLQLRYDQLVDELQKKEQQQIVSNEAELARRERAALSQARTAMGKYDELAERASGLDADNRELQTRLARSQKQYQALIEQNDLLRQQLRKTVDQLAQSQQSALETERQVKALQASARRIGGARITANNSLKRSLTAVSVDGLDIRQDGELVRILIPSDDMFSPGTANMVRGAEQRVDRVADVLLRSYPNQIIGVEAHTDNSRVNGTLWRSSHQLTAAQAVSIFEQLSYRHRILPDQLFVMGHGANQPIASNATAAGKSRNRRVEIVIYPDTVSGRR